mmetsp:Transcript_48001/g.124662  ORF Transcript_48001/g.124662 Transcript_48001/m.124662 type:complete len:1113 (-) Transcript_48001:158-3496(-)
MLILLLQEVFQWGKNIFVTLGDADAFFQNDAEKRRALATKIVPSSEPIPKRSSSVASDAVREKSNTIHHAESNKSVTKHGNKGKGENKSPLRTRIQSPVSKTKFQFVGGDHFRVVKRQDVPLRVTFDSLRRSPQRILQVACGKEHTLLATNLGSILAFGSNRYCQLGTKSRTTPVPIVVENAKDATGQLKKFNSVTQVACGSHFSAAVNSKGELFTWGCGLDGQLGHGTFENVPIPSLVKGVQGSFVTKIACGGAHMAVMTNDGESELRLSDILRYLRKEDLVKTRSYLESVRATNTDENSTPGDLTWSQLEELDSEAKRLLSQGCCNMNEGTVLNAFCWGANTFGQIGNGTQSLALTPQKLSCSLDASGIGFSKSTLEEYIGNDESSKFMSFSVEDIACGDHHTTCIAKTKLLSYTLDKITHLPSTLAPGGAIGRRGSVTAAVRRASLVEPVGAAPKLTVAVREVDIPKGKPFPCASAVVKAFGQPPGRQIAEVSVLAWGRGNTGALGQDRCQLLLRPCRMKRVEREMQKNAAKRRQLVDPTAHLSIDEVIEGEKERSGSARSSGSKTSQQKTQQQPSEAKPGENDSGYVVPLRVYCGANTTAVLSSDGRLFVCGQNSNGQLGIGLQIEGSVSQDVVDKRISLLVDRVPRKPVAGARVTLPYPPQAVQAAKFAGKENDGEEEDLSPSVEEALDEAKQRPSPLLRSQSAILWRGPPQNAQKRAELQRKGALTSHSESRPQLPNFKPALSRASSFMTKKPSEELDELSQKLAGPEEDAHSEKGSSSHGSARVLQSLRSMLKRSSSFSPSTPLSPQAYRVPEDRQSSRRTLAIEVSEEMAKSQLKDAENGEENGEKNGDAVPAEKSEGEPKFYSPVHQTLDFLSQSDFSDIGQRAEVQKDRRPSWVSADLLSNSEIIPSISTAGPSGPRPASSMGLKSVRPLQAQYSSSIYNLYGNRSEYAVKPRYKKFHRRRQREKRVIEDELEVSLIMRTNDVSFEEASELYANAGKQPRVLKGPPIHKWDVSTVDSVQESGGHDGAAINDESVTLRKLVLGIDESVIPEFPHELPLQNNSSLRRAYVQKIFNERVSPTLERSSLPPHERLEALKGGKHKFV